jgi:hypothetical protein
LTDGGLFRGAGNRASIHLGIDVGRHFTYLLAMKKKPPIKTAAATSKAVAAHRGEVLARSVLGKTPDGVFILRPRSPATHFTDAEIVQAVVRVKGIGLKVKRKRLAPGSTTGSLQKA